MLGGGGGVCRADFLYALECSNPSCRCRAWGGRRGGSWVAVASARGGAAWLAGRPVAQWVAVRYARRRCPPPRAQVLVPTLSTCGVPQQQPATSPPSMQHGRRGASPQLCTDLRLHMSCPHLGGCVHPCLIVAACVTRGRIPLLPKWGCAGGQRPHSTRHAHGLRRGPAQGRAAQGVSRVTLASSNCGLRGTTGACLLLLGSVALRLGGGSRHRRMGQVARPVFPCRRALSPPQNHRRSLVGSQARERRGSC